MDPNQVQRDAAGTLRCRQCGFAYDLDPAGIDRETRIGLSSVDLALGQIPAGARTVRPEPDVWSINAYMSHLAEAAGVIHGRVCAIAEQDRPELPYYDQDREVGGRDADHESSEVSLQEMHDRADRFLTTIAALPPDAFQRTGVHPVGEVTLLEISHDMPHELIHHAGDMLRIGAQVSGGNSPISLHVDETESPPPSRHG